MTKKKKNARERRALVGALCTAAVIVAGSTFAWFTSSDEVTNRLSASADYNVSIVESFTPPKNWIPGQEIEKEVYATNTGNIGAFVEQDVSGALTITVEKPETTWSADCVELTKAERYSMEAGSYLALKPNGSTKVIGEQAVSVTPNSTDPNAYVDGTTNFTPDADGLYVFRRSIGVDSKTRAETFEYAGYFYKSGKYYKTEITNVTPDTTADFAADGVSNDGNLTAAECNYFKEETKVLNPASMVYEATNNRLVASYDTEISSADRLVALAQAYDSAIEEYERAAEAVTRATADSGNSSADLAEKKAALDAAYSALQATLDAQSAAATNLANATIAKENATATKDAAQAAVDNSLTSLYGGTDKSESNYTDGSLKGTYEAAKTAKNNAGDNSREQFEADFAAWVSSSSNDSGNTGDLSTFTYEQFMHFPETAQNQDYYTKVAEEKRAKEAYEAELTKLIGSTNPTATPTATSLQGQLNSATTAAATAESEFTATNAAKTAADEALYGAGGTSTAPTNPSAQYTYSQALADYNAAATANGSNSSDLANATAALAAAAAAKNAAEAAYNAANNATPSDGILKININLSDNVVTAGGEADKWQLFPNPIANSVAKFYYTSILPGGGTSSKLIESVELDESATQDMYKSFDFDLNVALKSAQITYGTDNVTILTTPANETLDANATLITPTSEASPITWAAKPASGGGSGSGGGNP